MLATSLTTAFLLLLERLTPKERAAYLLHDIFDQSYGDMQRRWRLMRPLAENSFRAIVRTSIATRFATSRQGKCRTIS